MTLYAPFRAGDAESSLSNIPTPPELPAMDPELYSSNTPSSSSFTLPSTTITRHPSISQSPPHMSPLTSVEAMYTASPQLVTRTNSTTPDPTNAEGQLAAGMGIRDGECQRAFMPSPVPRQGGSSMWSACMGGSQTGSDDFDNYSLHSSRPGPVTNELPPSSRSWTPPEHIRSVSWDHYPRQHTQLVPPFPLRDHYAQGPAELTSFPTDGLPYTLPLHGYDGSEGSFLQRSQTEPCPRQYQNESHRDAVSTPESLRALSPCSTTLALKADCDEGVLSPAPLAPQPIPGSLEELMGGGPHTPPPIGTGTNGSQIDSSAPSPASAAVIPGGGGGAPSGLAGGSNNNNNNKNEEPYAKLIYRAFMSKPNHAMTLQEIYQWFRDNTDKGKDDTKGWQNSIRHNLSMNMAFTKRERKSSNASQSDPPSTEERSESTRQAREETKPIVLASSSSSSSPTAITAAVTSADQKKSTEWYLEPWAIHEGVQSTTRYRKGNQSRRSGALSSSSLPSSSRGPSYHRYDDFSRRSSSGHRGSKPAGVYAGRIRAASASRHAQTNMRNHAQNIAHAMAQAQVAAMTAGYYPPPPPPPQTSPYAGNSGGFYPTGPLVQVDMPAMVEQQLDYHQPQDGYYLHSQRSAASTRAPSDEPVTPEPVHVGLAYGPGTPDGLLLPDLRTTSASNGDYHGGMMHQHPGTVVYDHHHHSGHHNGWGASTAMMDDGQHHSGMGVVGYHQY
ncbi:hypothetical protein QBC41DRAFT_224668 [Cercophora samala]|uniref:Fork-head domain-containing protein n=1 Tax=Cercophora samala TaxID=330535 RepID=A0AA40DBM4_9PEZI|nr:hypothetical protein QBC41DRAFT_224668 [Cercophora samala]